MAEDAPHVRVGSKTVLTPFKWDVCVTPMHLASTIHCVDEEIIEWLKHREQRSKGKSCLKAAPNSNPMIAKSGSQQHRLRLPTIRHKAETSEAIMGADLRQVGDGAGTG
jgi:hypothetical protein